MEVGCRTWIVIVIYGRFSLRPFGRDEDESGEEECDGNDDYDVWNEAAGRVGEGESTVRF